MDADGTVVNLILGNIMNVKDNNDITSSLGHGSQMSQICQSSRPSQTSPPCQDTVVLPKKKFKASSVITYVLEGQRKPYQRIFQIGFSKFELLYAIRFLCEKWPFREVKILFLQIIHTFLVLTNREFEADFKMQERLRKMLT